MKKFTYFQIKLILVLCAILITIIVLFYYKLYSMNINERNVNITGINKADKIYTYSIYSDFYFNIFRFNEKGEKIAYFSQLIPTKSSIGFDFSENENEPKLIVNNYDNLGTVTLTEKNANELSNQIDILKSFSKEYSKITTVQDEKYFKESTERVKNLIKNLYNLEVKPADSIDSFYESEIPKIIDNLAIKPLKLENISKNKQKKGVEKCNKVWCPELLKWQFGENDNITLEYVKKDEKNTFDKFLSEWKKNINIIKITKVNNSGSKNLFILMPDNTNQIMSYFMDDNGYIYVLRYKYKNPESLKKYQNDFIKIAYGINFKDGENFENNYVKFQNKLNETKENLEKINQLDNELVKFDIYTYYNLSKNSNLAKNMSLEDIFTIYQNDNNFITTIEKEYHDKLLINEAIKKIPDLTTFFILSKAKEVKEKCPDLECIKNLKVNNWK